LKPKKPRAEKHADLLLIEAGDALDIVIVEGGSHTVTVASGGAGALHFADIDRIRMIGKGKAEMELEFKPSRCVWDFVVEIAGGIETWLLCAWPKFDVDINTSLREDY
jgi:hypothetical protein